MRGDSPLSIFFQASNSCKNALNFLGRVDAIVFLAKKLFSCQEDKLIVGTFTNQKYVPW